MKNICGNCFSDLPDGVKVCQACGYSNDIDRNKYQQSLPPGTILNRRFILGKVLYQGAFDITYIANEYKKKRIVAIKEYFPLKLVKRNNNAVIPIAGQFDENVNYGKKCFLDEAKTLVKLKKIPNILKVYGSFEENNTVYCVMEYARGINLKNYIEHHGKVSCDEAKKLLFPIMDALSVVHTKGIVHNDVAPENIVLCEDNTVKLLNFGAARYSLGDKTRSLDTILRAGFAPREQYLLHGDKGPFTDVYSLAATYYFLITGQIPQNAIDRQYTDDIIPPSKLGVDISGEMEKAIYKALEVSADNRYQSMEDFKQALQSEDDLIINNGPEKNTSKKKKGKMIAIIGIPATAVIVAFLIILNAVIIPNTKYNEALELMESGNYADAMKSFRELGDYKSSESKLEECRIADLMESNMQSLSAGISHTVALKSDGSVVAVGDDSFNQCKIGEWEDIVSVAAGAVHTVGLKSDGTVLAIGNNKYGQCDVEEWTDIVGISTTGWHTVGLKSDGTVVAAGSNDSGECEVDKWEDIVAVSAGYYHTIGLKSDGTVVATGDNSDGQCNIGSWKDIVAISAGGWHTVGVKSDGTVVAVGLDTDGRCDVDNWKDIVDVSARDWFTVGLKSDGTVVATGDNSEGQCDVYKWEDIVAVSAGKLHTVGLKSDGTAVAVGINDEGQCNISSWKNIKLQKNQS